MKAKFSFLLPAVFAICLNAGSQHKKNKQKVIIIQREQKGETTKPGAVNMRQERKELNNNIKEAKQIKTITINKIEAERKEAYEVILRAKQDSKKRD